VNIKDKTVQGFTRRHGVDILVRFEEFADIHDAIGREKRIKGWNRAWKIKLIEKTNPVRNDLTRRIL
jgi:putative endonuclease